MTLTRSCAPIIVCALLVTLPRAVAADTVLVGPSRPCTTITCGIQAANNGDTVLIDDGFYQETLIVNKSLRLEAMNVGGAVVDGSGTSGNVIDVFAPSTFYGLVIQNGNSGIVSGSGMVTAADYTAERILARDLSGSAFGVNTLGPRTGVATINNSTIINTANAFGINDGNRIVAKNNVLAHVTTAYVIHNGNQILPDHNLLFDVTDRVAFGQIPGIVGTDPSELIMDPLFVDELGMNFRLTLGSPAIDSGVDVGLSFLGPEPDRGAFEFVPEPSGFALVILLLLGAPLIRRKDAEA